MAPVTSTGPEAGVMPACSSFWTHSAAVKPAVPIIMLACSERPAGHFTAHPAGIRMRSAKPPEVPIPRSKPMAITSSPGAKSSCPDSRTTPAASIPGVWGKLRVTPGLPVAERPSLKLSDEYLTSINRSPAGSSLSSRSIMLRVKPSPPFSTRNARKPIAPPIF